MTCTANLIVLKTFKAAAEFKFKLKVDIFTVYSLILRMNKTRQNVACEVWMCILEISDTCSDISFVMQWHSDMLSVFFRLLSLTDCMWLSLNHSTLLNGCFVPHLFIKPARHDSWRMSDSHSTRRHQHLLKSSWWPWVNIPELTQCLASLARSVGFPLVCILHLLLRSLVSSEAARSCASAPLSSALHSWFLLMFVRLCPSQRH